MSGGPPGPQAFAVGEKLQIEAEAVLKQDQRH